MLETNSDIEVIIDSAVNLAVEKNHEYVTLEHLLYAMVTHNDFRNLLERFGGEVDLLTEDLEGYLNKQDYLVTKVPDVTPKKTHSLERVFNRAYTQVLFSGRQQMQIIDLYLSVMSEEKSYAQYLLTKYGFQRNKLVDFWNNEYSESKSKKRSRNAVDHILTEYCENLNELAEQGKIDPVIGRSMELDEIVHVLAKRNKSNVLMWAIQVLVKQRLQKV